MPEKQKSQSSKEQISQTSEIDEIDEISQKIKLSDFFDFKIAFMISLAVLILVSYLIFENISIFQIMDAFVSGSIVLLVLAVIAVFLALFLDTLGWKLLLEKSIDYPLSTYRCYKVFLASWSYNLMIPSAGASEIAVRAALSHSEFKEQLDNTPKSSTSLVVSSIMFHRTLGGFAQLPVAFIAIYAIVQFNIIPGLTPEGALILFLFSSLLITAVIIIVIFVSFKPEFSIKVTHFIFTKLTKIFSDSKRLERWRLVFTAEILFFAEEYRNYFSRKRLVLLSFSLIQISAFVHWLALFLIFSAFFYVSFFFVGGVSFLLGILDLIPAGIPGMAGIKEVTLSALLNIQNGNNTSLSFSTALISQILRVYLVIFVGIIAFAMRKRNNKILPFNAINKEEKKQEPAVLAEN